MENHATRDPALPSTTDAEAMEICAPLVDGSSLRIVPVPTFGASVAFTGAEGVSGKDSSGTVVRSPLITSPTCAANAPAAILAVPDSDVNSVPAGADRDAGASGTR